MQEPKITQEETAKVRNYMLARHCGYKNAVPRREIVLALGIEDRHLRAICAEIPEILTSSHYGYWCLPLVDTTGLEADIAQQVIEGEDRRRIIALYLRNRRQRQAIKRMRGIGVQQEMFT